MNWEKLNVKYLTPLKRGVHSSLGERKEKREALVYIKWSAICIFVYVQGTIHDIPLTGTGISYYHPVIMLIC